MDKKISTYKDFKDERDILHIFDYDNTLVVTPEFNKLAIKFLQEGVTIKSMLSRSIKQVNAKIDDLKIENGRIFLNDPEKEITPGRDWIRRKSRLYLKTPDKFIFTDLSIPEKLNNKISDIYKEVTNKAIVTGRLDDIKNKVEKSISDLGLKKPNYGIHCYPSKTTSNGYNAKVPIWKAEKIISLIKKSKCKKAIFYEDNRKWLNKVVEIINKELPDFDFEGVKVRKPIA